MLISNYILLGPIKNVNYNQAVKALHTGLSEKKALAMLYKLEQLTIELISLNREIIRLTQEFEQWLQK